MNIHDQSEYVLLCRQSNYFFLNPSIMKPNIQTTSNAKLNRNILPVLKDQSDLKG